MDNKNMKYINTDNLTAIIYEDGDLKLQVYNNYPSPYGYVRRDLLSSPLLKNLKNLLTITLNNKLITSIIHLTTKKLTN